MRDRILILLLFGVGIVKIYEEYEDEEHEDGGSPDMIKHKHSRRDVDDTGLGNWDSPSAPLFAPLEEHFIEALHMERTAALFSKCSDVSDECSCRLLLCLSPGDCNGPAERALRNETSKLRLRNISPDEHLFWVKRCRQATLAGQSLCECRRGLYRKTDLKYLQSTDSDVNSLEPALH
ncbi:hypothetical protein FGIG_02521 [Fasciola gigantica]|uniref:GDNF/GAS1 domain-containing protein n=1 Tax=Fasciola gigantica TaxID=46835 RepID=A0A504Z0V4_FASGI|nr:hypothetical protein FGIG_02521 [Fasciola gigantica]